MLHKSLKFVGLLITSRKQSKIIKWKFNYFYINDLDRGFAAD